MNGAPPRWLDRAVTRLVPPAAREEVMGDLWERYRSPARFAADALRVVPWLVASRVRRAVDPALFTAIGFILLAALGGLEPARTPLEVPIALRALPAAAFALAALVLRQIYRTEGSGFPAHAGSDFAWLIGGIALSQALAAGGGVLGLISPQWALPIGWVVGGSLFSALTLLLLRSEAEVATFRPRRARLEPGEALAELRGALRARHLARSLGLIVLAAVAAAFALGAKAMVATGAEIVAAGALFLFARGLQAGGADDCLTELERQRGVRVPIYWWIAAPVLAGIAYNVIAFGWAMRQPVTFTLGTGACIVLVLLVSRLASERKRCLGIRIALLKELTSASRA